MKKRKLGKTELMVSEIGLGGIPIQRVTKEDVKMVVDELINQGVNFIDTARGYTCSEEYLGYALKGRRDKFVLCTKSMARTYDDMKKDVLTSLKNLQTNYIDIYQFHNLKSKEDYDIIMGKSGAYKALLEAKASGKIGYIGITSHSLDFLESIIDDFHFQTIQFPYNIVEDKAESLFKKAISKDIGIITMKPLAGGAIDDKGLALKFILSKDFVTVAIPGMATVEEVKMNCSVKDDDFTKEEIDKIKAIKEDLSGDFCRRCGYCLPCTQGIDIPNCFVFQGYYERYNLKDWAIGRYDALKKHASDCIKCHACEKRCPYGLKISEKLERVKDIFGK